MSRPNASARRALASYAATTVGGLLIAVCIGFSLVEIRTNVEENSVRCGSAWAPDLRHAGTPTADLCNAAVDERRSAILVLFPMALALTTYGAIARRPVTTREKE